MRLRESLRSRGMTLAEVLIFLSCGSVAVLFSELLGSSHHWALGVVALPLGFCAAAMIFVLLGEIAVRLGYSPLRGTPWSVLQRSILVGLAAGLPAGVAFVGLTARGTIPTTGAWLSDIISAASLGLSVALTVGFVFMARHR
jgi:hypothetical protein